MACVSLGRGRCWHGDRRSRWYWPRLWRKGRTCMPRSRNTIRDASPPSVRFSSNARRGTRCTPCPPGRAPAFSNSLVTSHICEATGRFLLEFRSISSGRAGQGTPVFRSVPASVVVEDGFLLTDHKAADSSRSSRAMTPCQSPGQSCHNSLLDGYQRLLSRSRRQRQSAATASSSQSGLPMLPAR